MIIPDPHKPFQPLIEGAGTESPEESACPPPRLRPSAANSRGLRRRQWLRRRREARRLAQADAEALYRDHGVDAYSEARKRERDGQTPERWSRVALAVARITGKQVGLDTATRMAMNADFSAPEAGSRPTREPIRKAE